MDASKLSVSTFDGKKLLVVMTILAAVLTVESSIGYIADFIPEQLSSNQVMVGVIVSRVILISWMEIDQPSIFKNLGIFKPFFSHLVILERL